MGDFKRSVILSFMLHSLLLTPFVLKGCGGGGDGTEQADKDKGGGESEKDKIAEKRKKEEEEQKKTLEIEIVELPKRPKTPHEDEECPSGKHYGGIGIYGGIGPEGQYVVLQAVPGYPAYNAGIQRGDQIVEPHHTKIKGEIGTELTLVVRTIGGNLLTTTIVRDKICLEAKNDTP